MPKPANALTRLKAELLTATNFFPYSTRNDSFGVSQLRDDHMLPKTASMPPLTKRTPKKASCAAGASLSASSCVLTPRSDAGEKGLCDEYTLRRVGEDDVSAFKTEATDFAQTIQTKLALEGKRLAEIMMLSPDAIAERELGLQELRASLTTTSALAASFCFKWRREDLSETSRTDAGSPVIFPSALSPRSSNLSTPPSPFKHSQLRMAPAMATISESSAVLKKSLHRSSSGLASPRPALSPTTASRANGLIKQDTNTGSSADKSTSPAVAAPKSPNPPPESTAHAASALSLREHVPPELQTPDEEQLPPSASAQRSASRSARRSASRSASRNRSGRWATPRATVAPKHADGTNNTPGSAHGRGASSVRGEAGRYPRLFAASAQALTPGSRRAHLASRTLQARWRGCAGRRAHAAAISGCKQRAAAVVSFYRSERRYLSQLQTLHATFYLLLREHGTSQAVLRSIFSTSQVLLNLSRLMLSEVDRLRSTPGPPSTRIGEVVTNMLPMFSCYRSYIGGFLAAQAAAADLRARDAAAAAALANAEARCGECMLALLAAPARRLPTYALHLDELRKLAAPNAAPPLARALEAVHALCKELDESLHDQQCHARVHELERQLGGCAQLASQLGDGLAAPHRRFVLDGALDELRASERATATASGGRAARAAHARVPRRLFLFNDLLVTATPVGPRAESAVRVHDCIPLAKVKVARFDGRAEKQDANANANASDRGGAAATPRTPGGGGLGGGGGCNGTTGASARESACASSDASPRVSVTPSASPRLSWWGDSPRARESAVPRACVIELRGVSREWRFVAANGAEAERWACALQRQVRTLHTNLKRRGRSIGSVHADENKMRERLASLHDKRRRLEEQVLEVTSAMCAFDQRDERGSTLLADVDVSLTRVVGANEGAPRAESACGAKHVAALQEVANSCIAELATLTATIDALSEKQRSDSMCRYMLDATL